MWGGPTAFSLLTGCTPLCRRLPVRMCAHPNAHAQAASTRPCWQLPFLTLGKQVEDYLGKGFGGLGIQKTAQKGKLRRWEGTSLPSATWGRVGLAEGWSGTLNSRGLRTRAFLNLGLRTTLFFQTSKYVTLFLLWPERERVKTLWLPSKFSN